jgi:hypothetical protein
MIGYFCITRIFEKIIPRRRNRFFLSERINPRIRCHFKFFTVDHIKSFGKMNFLKHKFRKSLFLLSIEYLLLVCLTPPMFDREYKHNIVHIALNLVIQLLFYSLNVRDHLVHEINFELNSAEAKMRKKHNILFFI